MGLAAWRVISFLLMTVVDIVAPGSEEQMIGIAAWGIIAMMKDALSLWRPDSDGVGNAMR